MLIGELASATGASVRSLRHYERVGLVHSTRKDNGYRDFDKRQIEQVSVIRDLLGAGLNLKTIAIVAPCFESGVVPTRCARAEALLHQELDHLATRRQNIDTAIRRITDLMER